MSKKKNPPKQMPLSISLVRFDADAHKYWLGDKELSGITSMLSRMLFADKYKNVDKAILDKAADRGSNIHFEISMYETASLEPSCKEAKNYVEKIRPTLNVWCSEYLVSDCAGHATSVDIVCRDGDGAFLIDVKSNRSGVDMEYVRWQLSCCAYLFEQQNPLIAAKRLAALWLSDDNAELIEVERIPSEVIAKLLEADSQGLPFDNPLKPVLAETKEMAEYRTFEQEYMILMARIKELDELKKKALEAIEKTLGEYEATVLETEHFKFTKVAASVRQTLDRKKFEEEHPGVLDGYMKQSVVKGYIKVALK